jgi:hypothetical protein
MAEELEQENYKPTKPKGKPIRTVIVHDLAFNGDMKQAGTLLSMLEDYAEGFLSYVASKDTDLAKVITIEQTQAAIPYKTERRGLTGSLEELVFRGSRGKNYNPDRAPIPKDVPPGIKQKLYSFRQHLENKGFPRAQIEHKIKERYARLIDVQIAMDENAVEGPDD